MAHYTMPTSTPRPTFAILADAHKVGERGKIDCYGVFDVVGVWATPATRECSIVFGVQNVPAGTTKLSLWLRTPGQKAVQLGTASIQAKDAARSIINAARIQLLFTQFGPYELGVAAGETSVPRHALWIPLAASSLPWPSFPTGEELQKLLADPHTIKTARVQLTCNKCRTNYVFQVSLDPAKPLERGVLPFPGDGLFTCPKCRTIHQLKDLEGQLRAQVGRPASESEK